MSEITFAGASGFRASINFVGMYSDGTPMVKDDQYMDIVQNADTMILRQDSLSSFVVAMFLADSIKAAGGRLTTLVIPFLPGARQDRVNVKGDVLFTASSVAQMINSRGFSRVITVDPHSPVMPSFIGGLVEYPLGNIAGELYAEHDGIIAPDKGAKDRAEKFAAVTLLDVTYASKNRDVSTGRLSGFSVDVEKGKHYLVVDDICDGGGTFIGLGEKILEQGATADLYVTHGIFSKGTDELKKIYKNIITTDSRQVHERNNVMIVPIVKDMENYND